MDLSFDESVIKQVEQEEKDRGKPYGAIERVTRAAELQKIYLSEEACNDAKKVLIDLQGQVRDLVKAGASIASLKPEFMKLGTALGMTASGKSSKASANPEDVKAKIKFPTTAERQAAILLAITESGIEKLQSGHIPQALVTQEASANLRIHGAVLGMKNGKEIDNLPPTSVQAAYKKLCQQPVRMTEEDKQTSGITTGNPVKVKIREAFSSSDVAAARATISGMADRIKKDLHELDQKLNQ